MKLKRFTKKQLQDSGPYEEDTNAALRRLFDGRKTLTIVAVLESDISITDKVWVFCCKNLGTTELQRRYFACSCAASVLNIFEDKFPNDSSPRNAIEAGWKVALENTESAHSIARDASSKAAASAGDARLALSALSALSAARAADNCSAYDAAEAAELADDWSCELQVLFMYEAIQIKNNERNTEL